MTAKIVVKSIIYNKRLNKILLVQRCKDDSVGADTWENVGGNVEDGETLDDALRREITEEAGISDIRIDRVAYAALVNAQEPYLIVAYLCEALTDNICLSSEHQAFLWAGREDCFRLLPSAIIDDFENNGIFEYCGLSE